MLCLRAQQTDTMYSITIIFFDAIDYCKAQYHMHFLRYYGVCRNRSHTKTAATCMFQLFYNCGVFPLQGAQSKRLSTECQLSNWFTSSLSSMFLQMPRKKTKPKISFPLISFFSSPFRWYQSHFSFIFWKFHQIKFLSELLKSLIVVLRNNHVIAKLQGNLDYSSLTCLFLTTTGRKESIQ